MSSAASRTLWKGAISFGLVHIPVGLHAGVNASGVDFDWLDKRTLDPVGYKRINKRTGKEIASAQIVKGVAYEKGRYVILTPEEIEAAYPRTTQTIEIDRFVNASEIPFFFLERPYYLEPLERGEKVYALLRDALLKTGRIGLAKVVIATRQHLAALVPVGPALVLNLLRWSDEVRPMEGLNLPAHIHPSAGEMKMAVQLIEQMSGPWEPAALTNEFKERVMELVRKKAQAGQSETVTQPQEQVTASSAEVIDLVELLKRSLKGGSRAAAAPAEPARKPPTGRARGGPRRKTA